MRDVQRGADLARGRSTGSAERGAVCDKIRRARRRVVESANVREHRGVAPAAHVRNDALRDGALFRAERYAATRALEIARQRGESANSRRHAGAPAPMRSDAHIASRSTIGAISSRLV